MLAEAGPNAFVDASEPFAVIRSPDEGQTVATERYKRYFEAIGWNDEVRQLVDFCSHWPADGPIAAIHVRAGDIIDGDWRHVVGHEKYSPTPFVHQAIERLTEHGRRRALLLSDNAQYLAWLKDRFPTLITSAEVIPGYAGLTQLQQALADILLLAQCEPIVGPPSSAFSRLAANLGPGELVRADRMVPPGRERVVLRTGIAASRRHAADAQFFSALVARDICWCLDVFSDTMPLGQQQSLARRAVELDAGFLAAQARLARVAALAGDWRSALRAAGHATRIGQAAERHDEPLMEALATDIACKCIAAVQGRLRPPTDASVSHLPSLLRRDRGARDWEADAASLTADLNRTFGRCLELEPAWFATGDVIDGLRSLMAIAARLVGETPGVRRDAATRLANADYDDLDLQALRPSGLMAHRAEPTYDPLTRDLDAMALYLYEAVDGAELGIEPPRLARGAYIAPRRA